jgi:1-acyl-sn-glycerol-3-phosphate acyltransferase
MRKQIVDRKSWLTYSVFSCINNLAVRLHFKSVSVQGLENLPSKGACLIVSNHISRWDGLVLHSIIGRPSNFMVSPNELRGLQGLVLRSCGSFPADARVNLMEYVRGQVRKGESLVIFPEGNLFRDQITHPFKNGAARIALMCQEEGIVLPVLPMAIRYEKSKPDLAQILVGTPVDCSYFCDQFRRQANLAIGNLSVQLHREVCHLRFSLGDRGDKDVIFTGKPVRAWISRYRESA